MFFLFEDEDVDFVFGAGDGVVDGFFLGVVGVDFEHHVVDGAPGEEGCGEFFGRLGECVDDFLALGSREEGVEFEGEVKEFPSVGHAGFLGGFDEGVDGGDVGLVFDEGVDHLVGVGFAFSDEFFAKGAQLGAFFGEFFELEGVGFGVFEPLV